MICTDDVDRPMHERALYAAHEERRPHSVVLANGRAWTWGAGTADYLRTTAWWRLTAADIRHLVQQHDWFPVNVREAA